MVGVIGDQLFREGDGRDRLFELARTVADAADRQVDRCHARCFHIRQDARGQIGIGRQVRLEPAGTAERVDHHRLRVRLLGECTLGRGGPGGGSGAQCGGDSSGQKFASIEHHRSPGSARRIRAHCSAGRAAVP